MSSDVAIRVANLSKCYQIYDTPRDRLKQFVLPRAGRILGRKTRHYFKEFWALKDVSFEVKQGETVGIIGRNGSGKSTLLQIICGTLNPTGGSVECYGRIAALLELGSGFNPEFTGRENVYMNAALLGLSNEEIDNRFDDIKVFADIGDFIEQPVKTYSSGMLLRLAFAVIANVDADILVVDEALAVGDAFFTQKCMRFLRRFSETGTLLFVSHDSSAVINLCNHALWLEKGNARKAGTAKEVCESYLESFYENQYGGTKDAFSIGNYQVNTEESTLTDIDLTQQYDQRLDFINTTNLRNDLEVFAFDEQAPAFGVNGAVISNVLLLDSEERRLSWVVGGENVTLVVEVNCVSEIFRPIIGFFIKDRLGQVLFGDNTFITYMEKPLHIPAGRRFRASFSFRMPILPMGDYSVCVAVAEGTQHDHIQHHWIHDALIIKSNSTSITTGLIGVPMLNIVMKELV